MSTQKKLSFDSGIRMNRKLRFWNKYKNYIFAGIGGLFLIIVVIVFLKSCGNNGSAPQDTSSKSTDQGTQGQTQSQDQTQPQDQTQSQGQTQAPTQPPIPTAKVYTTTKKVTREDFTAQNFFRNSVFLGDAIATGIRIYNLLPAEQVVADGNMTTDKAMQYVDEVVSRAPEKVFIMLGLNDLNYGAGRTTDIMAAFYESLVNDIHTKLPNAKIYIVSTFPITQEHEAKPNVYITKANLDAINNRLKEMAATHNFEFIDLGTSLQDGTGYLEPTITGNGFSINGAYYGFLLNTMAEMLQ